MILLLYETLDKRAQEDRLAYFRAGICTALATKETLSRATALSPLAVIIPRPEDMENYEAAAAAVRTLFPSLPLAIRARTGGVNAFMAARFADVVFKDRFTPKEQTQRLFELYERRFGKVYEEMRRGAFTVYRDPTYILAYDSYYCLPLRDWMFVYRLTTAKTYPVPAEDLLQTAFSGINVTRETLRKRIANIHKILRIAFPNASPIRYDKEADAFRVEKYNPKTDGKPYRTITDALREDEEAGIRVILSF